MTNDTIDEKAYTALISCIDDVEDEVYTQVGYE
jgi:hypothetical protein